MASITKQRRRGNSLPWLAQVNVQGFKRSSKRFATEKEAKAWAEPLERELIRNREGAVRDDVAKLTLADLCREYLEDPATVGLKAYDDYSNCIAWWVAGYGADRLMKFGVLRIREARSKLMHGRAPATVNRYLAYMRSCWNWGRNSGLVPQDRLWPTAVALTEPKGRTKHLTDEQLRLVIDAAAKHGPTVKALVLVSIACGLRKGELLRLTWADVDAGKQTLRVLVTKNGDARGVHIPGSALAAIEALRPQDPAPDAPVFVDEKGKGVTQTWVEPKWRKIRTAAGLGGYRWHDFRHACASILAQNGAGLHEIGGVLGHKSPSATFRYSHLVEARPVRGHAELDKKLAGL